MVTEITLSSKPNQTYSVSVSGTNRNVTFNITQSYNEIAGYWMIGIYDQANNPIVLNIPLLPGYDLLGQYGYLNIGELYLINYGDQTIEVPNDTNIENNFKLLWVLQ